MGLPEPVRSLGRFFLDYALPPRCPGCGCVVDEDHRFCLDCWSRLDQLVEPCCARCGVPFALPVEAGALCGACLADPPPYDSARAALAYGDIARDIAMRLKYGRRLGFARLMAGMMARRLAPEASGEAGWILVPVPLHRWRMWYRGFNQAALVARALGKMAGLPVELTVLRRHRATRKLRDMDRAARRAAVDGAFSLAPAARELLRGRHILLVDDIHTTGSTVEACVAVLRTAAPASVHIIAFARVVRGAGEPGAERND